MTVRETAVSEMVRCGVLPVIRDTPPRNAAAPIIARIPGGMTSLPAQYVNNTPNNLPYSAPASNAGIIIPDGTFAPNVISN